jgi:hypothetical protein
VADAPRIKAHTQLRVGTVVRAISRCKVNDEINYEASKHLPAPLPMSTASFDVKGARQWTTETSMVGTTLIYRLSHVIKDSVDHPREPSGTRKMPPSSSLETLLGAMAT